MQVAGTIDRIEIKCETEEEKAHAQALINLNDRTDRRRPLMYWGDSDAFSGAFIINSVGSQYTDEEWAAVCAANAEASQNAEPPGTTEVTV